jgi:hypothetical protein
MRLEAFEGGWIMERTIEDFRAQEGGALDGVAHFTAAADGLLYAEEGWLTFGGKPRVRAQRRHEWRCGGANTIEVRFEDGRFFHRFRADEPNPAAVHDCPPDQYSVRYAFALWPLWRTQWRVRGPRKDYLMITDYRPAQPWATRSAPSA